MKIKITALILVNAAVALFVWWLILSVSGSVIKAVMGECDTSYTADSVLHLQLFCEVEK